MKIPALHAPGYNYLGPGTSDFTKAPKNKFDAIAKEHDLEYARIQAASGTVDAYLKFNEADRRFIKRMQAAVAAAKGPQAKLRGYGNVTGLDIEYAKFAIKVFQYKERILPHHVVTDESKEMELAIAFSEEYVVGSKRPADTIIDKYGVKWQRLYADQDVYQRIDTKFGSGAGVDGAKPGTPVYKVFKGSDITKKVKHHRHIPNTKWYNYTVGSARNYTVSYVTRFFSALWSNKDIRQINFYS